MKTLSDKELEILNNYFNATNYLAVGQLYLLNNPLLKEPLTMSDVKPRVVGHFGTLPGSNFIFTHLNRVITKYDLNMIYFVGPGHGGQVAVTNAYLDGTYTEVYPNITQDEKGLKKLFKQFSFPGGVSSHVAPETPGSIHEGGELGYSLIHAFGAVLDNPDLIAVSIVGDGEAETGTTSASWMINKFINKKFSGRVVPILNLNGNKMGSKSLLSTMTEKQLNDFFSSMSYHVIFVNGNHEEMYEALEMIYSDFYENYLIILNSPKGWTAIETDSIKIEGELKSHKNPLDGLKSEEMIEYIEQWLSSYRIRELYSKEDGINKDIMEIIPDYIIDNSTIKKINLPCLKKYEIKEKSCRNVTGIVNYITDIIRLNDEFRIFSPDELVSNGFFKLFDATYNNLVKRDVSKDGKIIEILNENVCQGLMQGYIQTGRNALFISYEAFMPIITSMVSQLAKYIYQSKKVKWRKDRASFTYILTSVCWENNYSHQNPEFINSILNKEYDFVNVYMPIDSNNALVVLEKCIKSKNCINVIVLSKRVNRQIDLIDKAYTNLKDGFNIIKNEENEDIIFFVSGDIIFNEVLEAEKMIQKELPYINTKIVYVSELMVLKNKKTYLYNLINKDLPKIYAFHGYPSVLKNILYDNNDFTILGYKDRSNIAGEALKKMYLNGVSRYNILKAAVSKLYERKKISKDEYIRVLNIKEVTT